MEHNVLSSIPGIASYPVVALVLFFASFAGLTIWFFLADRKKLDAIAQAPLLDESERMTESIHTQP